jgi:predicted RNase H-like nuclease
MAARLLPGSPERSESESTTVSRGVIDLRRLCLPEAPLTSQAAFKSSRQGRYSLDIFPSHAIIDFDDFPRLN